MYLITVRLFFATILSFLITYYLIPIFIAIAYRYNIVDVPDGNIKMHKKPTPYLGGAAVYLGFLATLAIVFPFDNQFFHFLVGSSLLFYIGLIDDLIVLRPLQKFGGQCVAVICFLRAGFYLKAHLFHNMWAIALSAFWMLLIINAFNLIDIMDGLAVTVAMMCTIHFLFIAFYTQQYLASILLAAMLGAFMAFYCFNKPKASLYLGDAGSLFIGGQCATIPFLFPWGNIHSFGYIIPLIILAIPLLEVGGLICIRTYRGIPFYKPSKDHFAHYLQRNGFSEYMILYFVVGASVALMSITSLFIYQYIELITVCIVGVIFFYIWGTFLFWKKWIYLFHKDAHL